MIKAKDSIEEKIRLSSIKKYLAVIGLSFAAGAYIFSEKSEVLPEDSNKQNQTIETQIEELVTINEPVEEPKFQEPEVKPLKDSIVKPKVQEQKYEVKKGILEIREMDKFIELPKQYGAWDNRLDFMQRLIDGSSKGHLVARKYFKVCNDYKKFYRDISPNNRAFQQLDENQKNEAADAVNKHYRSYFEKMIEQSMPKGKYEINKGILSIYYHTPKNPNKPNVKIILPGEIKKATENIEIMERRLQRKDFDKNKAYPIFLRTMRYYKNHYVKISPNHQIFVALNPEEKEKAAEFVNTYIISNQNSLIMTLGKKLDKNIRKENESIF